MTSNLKRAFLIGCAYALGYALGYEYGRGNRHGHAMDFNPNHSPLNGRFVEVEGGGGFAKPNLEKEQEKLIVETLVRHASPWREIAPTADAWKKEFPTGRVKTPIGEVKLGENQFNKLLFSKDKRSRYAGLLKPTLENPQYIVSRIEAPEKIAERRARGEKVERASVLQFIKAFEEKDRKYRGFLVASVSQDGGIEVSITAHRRDVEELAKIIRKNGILMYGNGR